MFAICYECKKFGENSLENEKQIEYENHIKLKSEYNELKRNYFIPNDRTLVLEFDYSQNKPIPKLPVNEVFYSRVLWFFVFNIHIERLLSSISSGDSASLPNPCPHGLTPIPPFLRNRCRLFYSSGRSRLHSILAPFLLLRQSLYSSDPLLRSDSLLISS